MPQHDETNPQRRHFLKLAAGSAAAVALVGTLPRLARGDTSLPHLKTTDPTAQALKYTEDASTVTDPKRKPGDICANCQFYQGKKGDAYGPCQLFPGKAVNAKGWCVSHTLKTNA
ncbi:MAG TPA: high-potential iron-sulfur protein [Rhodanobacteraceae bacterium]|nr:high-potential iron-sulfur protein [Rhodanobacteraceae bacterium]